LRRCGHGHQRNAGGVCFRQDAISGRVLNIANRNPASTVRFWDATPFQFHLRKSYAGSCGVVPRGPTTWFPEYLSILPTGNHPTVSRNEAIVTAAFFASADRPGTAIGRRAMFCTKAPTIFTISTPSFGRRSATMIGGYGFARSGRACREILCCAFLETMCGEITLPFSALSTSARAAPAFPSSDGEDRRYYLLPLPAPVFSPVRRRRFRCGAPQTA
jgi:hypothetical protein